MFPTQVSLFSNLLIFRLTYKLLRIQDEKINALPADERRIQRSVHVVLDNDTRSGISTSQAKPRLGLAWFRLDQTQAKPSQATNPLGSAWLFIRPTILPGQRATNYPGQGAIPPEKEQDNNLRK